MEQWEIELRKQLAQNNVQKEHGEENKNTLSLIVLIVLGVLTLVAYQKKSSINVKSWVQNQFNEIITKVDDKGIDDLKKQNEEIKKTIVDLDQKTKWNNDRIFILGLMSNENNLILQNDYDKNHLLFLDKDWKIDQEPHYIQISNEDRDYLKKYMADQ
jgi:hypothetical protein